MKNGETLLAKYADKHDLTKPTSPERVAQFEAQMHVTLPAEFREFLTSIGNGGEILVPGTVFYGIYDRNCGHVQSMAELLSYWNRVEIRAKYRMPQGFFVIGTTNYGNLIGIDAKTGKIVEWDHEMAKPFLAWDTLWDFLEEEIANYERYLQEEGE